MGIVTYTLMAYGITIVVSLAVVGIIVLIGKLMGKPKEENRND